MILSAVTDREMALHEVAVLNRDNDEVKFVYRDGCITARMRVDALPFVAAHLRQAVDLVCDAVDRGHQDLEPRFRHSRRGIALSDQAIEPAASDDEDE